jgi:hypothetical protein
MGETKVERWMRGEGYGGDKSGEMDEGGGWQERDEGQREVHVDKWGES